MSRQTRYEIEQSLLKGVVVTWTQNGKAERIQLETPIQRRLFDVILRSPVREIKGHPQEFISELSMAFDGDNDPAVAILVDAQDEIVAGPWYLKTIETEGFGGINAWKGQPFGYDIDGDSLIIEGPNGSGKSSLVGALTWAFREKRIRESEVDTGSSRVADVFDSGGAKIGKWPPLACYPDKAGLEEIPQAKVKLTFANPAGLHAAIERTLRGEGIDVNADSRLKIPDILIETGLMMPARLAQMRFGSDQTQLVEAVQMLTGLDEVAMLGDFAASLTHKSREYLGYAKAKNRDGQFLKFTEHLSTVGKNLTAIGRAFPSFVPKDAVDTTGEMSLLCKEISTHAIDSMLVVASDLAPTLDLGLATVQQQVAHAIQSAKADFENGLAALPISVLLESVEKVITDEVALGLASAIHRCRDGLSEAIALRRQFENDNRFQMKAIAGAWHHQHRDGKIEDCPLCDQSLALNPSLRDEIEKLRLAGEAAQRTFRDNLNAIRAALDAEIPGDISHQKKRILSTAPSESYETEIKAQFLDAPRYSDILTGLRGLVESALIATPSMICAEPEAFMLEDSHSETAEIVDAINAAERMLWLLAWKRQCQSAWVEWWKALSGEGDSAADGTFLHKLNQLDQAVKAGMPYRDAAKALSEALELGVAINAIDIEQKRREDIADSLSPLKELRKFAEAETKRAIEELSNKMTEFLDQIYISDKLKFRSANLEKKTGLTVRASIEPELCINASLVANTSWIRALLWAFIFAVRDEAIEQLGEDRLPLFVLDDPQATFDMNHSLRWIQRIVAFQTAPTRMQVLLTTYDESFLDQLTVAGFVGRKCHLSAANIDIGHVHIAEGRTVERAWQHADAERTADAAFSYIAKARIHIEAILKVMLRGEYDTRSLTLGKLRERIKTLSANSTPWTRHEFKELCGQLDGRAEIKYLEQSHHTEQRTLTYANAVDVEKFWRTKLEPTLNRAFRAIKEYRLLHGESKALHAEPSTVEMPDGYGSVVRDIPLVVRGIASASTGGRAADGNLSFEDLGHDAYESIVLGKHNAFRLAATTLEPVARKGDILLTSEHEKSPPGSLVVASYTDRLLARRFMTSVEHPDVAVLLAQAIVPSDIAAPVVVHRSTLIMQKVVGVLFDPDFFVSTFNLLDEVIGCGSENEIRKFIRQNVSLIKVSGASAEPYALDGQYLLVGQHIAIGSGYSNLDGRPVLATDSRGGQFFKRLRQIQSNAVVLESLHIGGDFPPIYLSTSPSEDKYVEKIAPVLGVLFER